MCEIARSSRDAYFGANCGRAILYLGHSQSKFTKAAAGALSYRNAGQIAIKL